jgi:hypothetical protein
MYNYLMYSIHNLSDFYSNSHCGDGSAAFRPTSPHVIQFLPGLMLLVFEPVRERTEPSPLRTTRTSIYIWDSSDRSDWLISSKNG